MDILTHIGTKFYSGRYPWGSGENPYQRNKNFLDYERVLRKEGFSEVEIANAFGINTKELRNRKTIAKAENKAADSSRAQMLLDKGYSKVAIGKKMGIGESSVRNLLDPVLQERNMITKNVADKLKERVGEDKYIDVGVGTERYMGISRTQLKTSLYLLEQEGYNIHKLKFTQLGTGKKTEMMVLTKPEVEWSELQQNQDKIRLVNTYTENKGRTFLNIEPVTSVNSERIMIRYSEDGGKDKDGVIELRRGVEDLSLGKSRYAQVRIGVDDTHFLKGMAMYSDDIPEGVDIIYNTNKTKDVKAKDVFKEMKKDPATGKIDQDNPFGATVKAGGQKHYIDKKGVDRLSPINILNEEGDWQEWSKTLSSQMLSKQKPSLAEEQLGLLAQTKKEELESIMSLTNPVVKKNLLLSFADDCDSSATHLEAAALPRQKWQVILPFPDMKENEIYAPNFRDGEKVALLRFPHGGIFEIPELTVNNKTPSAKKSIKGAVDAVGIHPVVAEQLSGADFDGDTVLVVPNSKGTIKTSKPIRHLIDFDPQTSYKAYDGMPKVGPDTGFHKQKQMGSVSNLITDMTTLGAEESEIVRAVKHSMVVIDAEKHNLNYKQSYKDNRIAQLKTKYQGGANKGASTIISKAGSDMRVDHRTDYFKIDPDTGKKIYKETGETYINNKGVEENRKSKSKRMLETEDAFELSSGTQIETVYATHANKLKALGNEARKAYLKTPKIERIPAASKTYKKEVDVLNAKLNVSLKNAPLERLAQLQATNVVQAKKAANPGLDKDDLKRLKWQALEAARYRVGAGKEKIKITPKEWEAIQAGAISETTLTSILNNTDMDVLKEYAMPRSYKGLTPAQVASAKRRIKSGYTIAEVADSLGVSTSTISANIEK